MKTKLLILAMLGGSLFASDFSIGIRIGPPPPPRAVYEVPPSPGSGYVWIRGYWYPAGNHYRWHDGYWTRPPYSGAVWVAPRHDNDRYFEGYWEGSRGRYGHDHRWDHDHGRRDYDRDHGHDHDRDHDRH